jgi:hypothetical protein
LNERERLLRVLKGDKADKTPWYGDLSWWHAAHEEIGDLPAAYTDQAADLPRSQSHFQLAPTTGDGYLRLHQDTGIGVMFYAPMVWRETFDEGIRFSSHTDGNSTCLRVTTPVGEIESVSEYLPSSFTTAVMGWRRHPGCGGSNLHLGAADAHHTLGGHRDHRGPVGEGTR